MYEVWVEEGYVGVCDGETTVAPDGVPGVALDVRPGAVFAHVFVQVQRTVNAVEVNVVQLPANAVYFHEKQQQSWEILQDLHSGRKRTVENLWNFLKNCGRYENFCHDQDCSTCQVEQILFETFCSYSLSLEVTAS